HIVAGTRLQLEGGVALAAVELQYPEGALEALDMGLQIAQQRGFVDLVTRPHGGQLRRSAHKFSPFLLSGKHTGWVKTAQNQGCAQDRSRPMIPSRRIAVTLPAGPRVEATLARVRWADAHGYTDAWFADAGAPDALTLAAALAGETRRL